MAFEHESGLPNAFDRAVGQDSQQALVFVGNRIIQGAELNEMQTIARARSGRFGKLLVKEGDRVEGAEALVDYDAETVLLASGRIYVGGDVLPVGVATLTEVPMTGRVSIGVRLVKTWVTADDDPNLLGLVPGTEGEGEPGAARELASITWALPDDGGEGEFVPVYTLLDGTIIDQTPPPALTGVMQQIALYDWDANGHYIVDGCDVTCIGKIDNAWVFSIGAGTANVQGYKRIRQAALRFPVEEDADLEDVVAETHNYDAAGGAATVVVVNRPPIADLTSAIIVKRVTETIVRGSVPGTADALQFNSVIEVESVVRGATTYIANTDYVLSAGQISWAPVGAEPSAGETYDVTYLYSDEVEPDAQTATTVTVSGGVQNEPITLRYLSKVPRIDLICMDLSGAPKYVKGIATRTNAQAPLPPTSLLKLAEVRNNWGSLPDVVNNGVRNYTYEQMRRFFNRLIDIIDQFDRQQSQFDILASTPVAKKGIFTDTFVDDYFRDQGIAQTAAVNQGVLQLAIDPVMLQLVGDEAVTLPYGEKVIVTQPLRTSAMKINPYANFTAMPAGMKLAPAVDFWSETQTQWLSDVTREFATAPDQPPGQTTITEVTEIRRSAAEFLRQIDIEVSLEGFGVGEELATLTFDDIDVKPAGTQTADANGEIVVEITIPANVPAGTKLVRATGAADSFAEARFVGEGTIDIDVMRHVTLITRNAPAPVTNITNVTNITQVTNVTVNQITQQIVQQPWTFPGSDGGDEAGSLDPLAQTFKVPAPYMIVGMNFRFTAIGNRANGVRVQLATVQNGYPTANVLAEDFISMATVQAGDLVEARFDLPVYCAPGREYCFVILTDDPDHAVAIAALGDIIADTQERVGAQPYTVGVLFTSSNRLTWTPHQDADLHFEIVAADFTDADISVDLWTGELDQVSDLMVRGSIELPTDEATFRYELVRASGDVVKLAPGQNVPFTDYLSEEVTVRAILQGNDRISPILYPGTMIAGGKLRDTGVYVTRAFDFGNDVALSALFAAKLPAGSSVTVAESVNGGGAWSNLALDSTGVLGDGWTEPKYTKEGVTGTQGQVRLTLTGTPAARPALARLRAYTL